jgi:hypothetical protein
MAPPIVPDPGEYLAIHLACCRYRRAGLTCATCRELAERAAAHAARKT